MNYQQTLDYLFDQLPMYHRVGAEAYKANLDNTLAICSLLGNPQNTFPTVHIAGTNGKGSTSHILASILQEKGFKTGLYTSPHLKDFRERIKINGDMIPEEKVVHFIERYKVEFEMIRPSFFEMTVGLAFNHFREEKVDIAIIEVGLGGRLDSTNVISPLLSVITNISFDHKQFLGGTLEKIAKEKAGIIKHGIPIVIGETQVDIQHVFIEKAKAENSEILFADSIFKGGNNRLGSINGTLRVNIFRKKRLFLTELDSPLGGIYQMKNIVTVCAACEMLSSSFIPISVNDIRLGILHVISNTGIAGRWQVLAQSPLTICDTGHNEAGIKEVLIQISNTPYNKLHFVFGMVNDKETDAILQILPKDATYYFCKANIPRGLDANELQIKASKFGLAGHVYLSVNEAIKTAQSNAEQDDLVFIGGSTFVVAEVI